MPNICRRHNLNTEHITQLIGILDGHIEAVRKDFDVIPDQLGELFALRAVVVAMNEKAAGKEAAKGARKKRAANRAERGKDDRGDARWDEGHPGGEA